MQSNATAAPDEQLVNHVPDELCIDVRAPRASRPAELYEQVRIALNRYLERDAGLLTATRLHRDGLDEHLARDVEPTGVRALGGEVLRSLARNGIASAETPTTRAPWLPLPLEASAAGTAGEQQNWHFYYQIGTDRVSFEPDALEQRHQREQRVRELTNLLNLAALGKVSPPSGGQWSLSGSQANWLTSGLPFSCGSPAALPRAEKRTDRRWEFRFGDAVNAALAEKPGTRRGKVIVAVLDTCPDRSTLDHHGNRRLAELLDALRIHAGIGLAPDYFEPPPDVPMYWNACLPWWQEVMPEDAPPRPEFAMPDHGLFVSGIVQDIAPDVEIHLVRVLNQFGVGDLLALEHVLRELPDRLLGDAGADARLVVNLSLGSAVPVPRQRYFGRWLPQSDAARHGRWQETLESQLLDRAHGGLSSTVKWLHDRGVLVVAAAGNDGLRDHLDGNLPPPRYPAYYEPVFAVAAAGPYGQPARYSNRGDVLPYGNGITTFGGTVLAPRSKKRPPVTSTASTGRRQNSIVGVYSSPTLPGGEPNRTGWVHWAGTSFSAPIVSALAARLWQQDGTQTPDDLMQRLRACARNIPRHTSHGTDLDGALDAPYLEAWQEPV